MRWLLVFSLLIPPATALAADEDEFSRFIAETEPLAPAAQQAKFHLPAGFAIELVASEPQIRKPINVNFDARGRLLVSGSVGYPFPAGKEHAGRDSIWRLSDADGDGRYELVETLADGLNIPAGVSPAPGGVIAFSIPRIQFFRESPTASGGRKPAVPSERSGNSTTRFQGFGSDDTHGLPSSFTWWIDGWVYGCQGESNLSKVSLPDGRQVTLNGGNTFRFRPDGSRFEPFARGQVNPFGLCFDPLGNLYSADSHSRPAYLLLRGASYPGLGTAQDGLGFGPEMMQHRHGSTGIAGIAYYAAEQFPPEYRDTLFIGNPVTGRINHDRLEAHGSTMQAIEQPDFLTCDDPWFRPVDIQLGPDGALYVADFYNRIIAHSLVPLGHAKRDRERGRIWRITWVGQDKERPARPAIPDLAEADAAELLRRLDDANLLIRTHATHQLVERVGRGAVAPLKQFLWGAAVSAAKGRRDARTTKGEGRRDARTTKGEGRRDARTTKGEGRRDARTTKGEGRRDARTTKGEGRRDARTTNGEGRRDARTTIYTGRTQPRQRAHAVWALARLGALNDELIVQLANDSDRLVRVHLLKALAEDPKALQRHGDLVRGRLDDADPFVRRAAADALGQQAATANVQPLLQLWESTPDDDELLIHTLRMALRNNLRAAEVFAAAAKEVRTERERQRLADICLGLPTAGSARFLFDYVQADAKQSPRRGEFLQHAARYLAGDSLPELYAFALTFRDQKGPVQRGILRPLYRGLEERGVRPPPEIAAWGLETARGLLASDDEPQVFAGIELAWELKLRELSGELAKLAAKTSPQPPLRTFAMDALAAVDAERAAADLGETLRDVAEDIPLRQKAADTLGKINSRRSREMLVEQLSVAPAALAAVIAQQLSNSRDGAGLLLDVVEQGKASPRLLEDAVVEQQLQLFREEEIDERLARLTENLPPQESRISRLIAQRRAGFAAAETDPNVGKQLFEKQCGICHQLGGQGKKVGPNLDGIGLRGVDRLLEDVLDPHRNVDKAYRGSVITLNSGRVLTGLIVAEEKSVIDLIDAEGKPVRISAEDIDERRRSALSAMPANVAERIPEAEFYDLLRYLLEQREKRPAP